METIAVERSLWVNAPRERIWQALTDPDQIMQWMVPNLPGVPMTRDESDKLLVHFGPSSIEFMQLEALNEPRQITVRSLPDRVIATTYTLDEDQNGTQVAIRMTGFESLIDGAQQGRLDMSAQAWEQTLQNLQAFVTGADLPNPHAFLSPLFGFWRESKKTLSVERSIWIDSSPDRVWYAITDPGQIQLWYSPGTVWRLSDLEVGGRFYVPDAESGAEKYVEVIELLDQPRQLVTRTVPEAPDTIVKGRTYNLKEEKGGTRLTIILSGYEQEPEDTRWRNMEENAFGFGMMFQNLEAHLAGQSLPFPMGF